MADRDRVIRFKCSLQNTILDVLRARGWQEVIGQVSHIMAICLLHVCTANATFMIFLFLFLLWIAVPNPGIWNSELFFNCWILGVHFWDANFAVNTEQIWWNAHISHSSLGIQHWRIEWDSGIPGFRTMGLQFLIVYRSKWN